MKFTNKNNIPLSLAVWLVTDEYDYVDKPNYISATSLLKPTRQLVLSKRTGVSTEASVDILSRVASQRGTALHNAIEKAWLTNAANALESLGYPKKVREAVVINPDESKVTSDMIPVWLEQRMEKDFKGWTIGGKFDMVVEYQLRDTKTTGTYTYINKLNDEKFRMQGSIYRWLNPNKIKSDTMYIDYIFDGWSANLAKNNQNYPQAPMMEYPLELKTVAETERFITNKLNEIERYMDAPESELPECTEDELWRSDPAYKYYKNPQKMSRSTKNFDNLHDANLRLAEDGGVGIVVTVPGEVKACKTCAAFNLCTQKDRYLASGELIISN